MPLAVALAKKVCRWIRPPLYKKQADAFFNDARIGTCEASTKSGKTHGAMIWLLEIAMLTGRAGRNYWWVAPSYGQAKIAYRRLKRAIPTWARRCNDSELTITLLNGAVMWFKTGEKPDNLYGEDVYAAVIDEASRMRSDSWTAVRSTLTFTRGPVRMIGNVKGRGNWFYLLCRKAEAGEPGMSYMKITAQDAVDAKILDADEIAGAKRDLPEHVYRELYECEPSDSGNNPFGYKHIKACTMPAIAGGPPVGFGADLAKSIDWTVVIGLNGDMQVCAFDRFQKPWLETIPAIVTAVGRKSALIDSTGVGDPVLEALQAQGSELQFEGFKFTAPSKQMLMEGLAVAIQRQQISFPDGPIRSELELFEYEYTRTGVRYSAPEGAHDDCVVALALAWRKCSAEAGIKPQTAQVARAGPARNNPGNARRYGNSRY